MARIQVSFHTNEVSKVVSGVETEDKTGGWGLSIMAGLNESPEDILAEALRRITNALKELPRHRRFSDVAKYEG